MLPVALSEMMKTQVAPVIVIKFMVVISLVMLIVYLCF